MSTTFSERLPRKTRRIAILVALASAAALHGQSFSSGSTGADGDLIVSDPGVTTFNKAPVGGGTIYHFNTIQIASGSTLRLYGQIFPNPLYFLAVGAVTINGTIDLSGQSGSIYSTATQRTQGMTVPGAGGFAGGSAAYGTIAARPGLGPAGGVALGCGNYFPGNGGFSGNQFLVPLTGGSGGGAYGSSSGGAGGGALLIASSVSIAIGGTINASGGSDAARMGAGGGAGGGVRLVAPLISGGGSINVSGGWSASSCASNSGILRMEAFQNTFAGAYYGTLYTAAPSNLFLPAVTALPSIMVTSIGGQAVPPNPNGSFVVPDVKVNSAAPLPVTIVAANIPINAVPTLVFLTENFPDQQITCTPLQGTNTSSTSSATVTLNPGYTVGFVTVTWVQ